MTEETNESPINDWQEGCNRAIFCVPGLFNTGWDFFRSLHPLFREEKIYPIYHSFPKRDRCFNESPDRKTGRLTLARDVEEFVIRVQRYKQAWKNCDFYLLGHSRGAMVGALALQQCPGLFKGMIFDAPSLPAGLMPTKTTLMRRVSFFPHWLKWNWNRSPIDRTFWGARLSVMNGLPKQIAREHFRKMVWESGAVIERLGKFPPAIDRNVFEKTPTRMVGHENDLIIPDELVKQWVSEIAHQHVDYVSTVGSHYALIHPDHGQIIADHYLDFLRN